MARAIHSIGVGVAALLAVLAAGAQPPQDTTGDPDVLRDLRDAFMVAEDFAAALEPAERVVELTESDESPLPVNDIMRLARIQAELEMFDEAELNYLKAIDFIRSSEGEFSVNLITAYQALGRAYMNDRDFASAIAVLEQAQHISQRDGGLYNVEQSGLIDDITMAHLGRGDTTEAREQQLSRLENAVRQFGEDDPRIVPFRNHLADYYDRSRLRISAREQYEESLAVQEAAYGESDARLLPTLRALLRIDFALGEVGEWPARIQQILAAHVDDLGARERSESLAILGDWALIRGAREEAESYYGRAYRSLAAESATDAAAAFAEPLMLDFVAPLSSVDRAARRNRPYTWGRIEIEFDVSAAGRAVNVEIDSVEPQRRIAADYERRIRETHFRPRLVDGMPAVTRGVRFSHDFRYYVDRR